MNLEERIATVLANMFNRPVSDITADTSPDTIEEWDSVMHINLVLALEEEFDVKFTDEQMLEMMNVSLIISTVKQMIGN